MSPTGASQDHSLWTWLSHANGTRWARRCEHTIAALRCVHRRAIADGLIGEPDNPAAKVAKPRRLPSTRRAVPDTRLAQINHVAATTGNDPALDALLLRLHTDTAARRGGALALRPADLDPDQGIILLREKGDTVRWQPISPTLMRHLQPHPGTATTSSTGHSGADATKPEPATVTEPGTPAQIAWHEHHELQLP